MKDLNSEGTGAGNVECSLSKRWFARFKKRYNLRNVRLHGEAKSADKEAIPSVKKNLMQIIRDNNYSLKQIYNADETSIFWKKMPTFLHLIVLARSFSSQFSSIASPRVFPL